MEKQSLWKKAILPIKVFRLPKSYFKKDDTLFQKIAAHAAPIARSVFALAMVDKSFINEKVNASKVSSYISGYSQRAAKNKGDTSSVFEKEIGIENLSISGLPLFIANFIVRGIFNSIILRGVEAVSSPIKKATETFLTVCWEKLTDRSVGTGTRIAAFFGLLVLGLPALGIRAAAQLVEVAFQATNFLLHWLVVKPLDYLKQGLEFIGNQLSIKPMVWLKSAYEKTVKLISGIRKSFNELLENLECRHPALMKVFSLMTFGLFSTKKSAKPVTSTVATIGGSIDMKKSKPLTEEQHQKEIAKEELETQHIVNPKEATVSVAKEHVEQNVVSQKEDAKAVEQYSSEKQQYLSSIYAAFGNLKQTNQGLKLGVDFAAVTAMRMKEIASQMDNTTSKIKSPAAAAAA